MNYMISLASSSLINICTCCTYVCSKVFKVYIHFIEHLHSLDFVTYILRIFYGNMQMIALKGKLGNVLQKQLQKSRSDNNLEVKGRAAKVLAMA